MVHGKLGSNVGFSYVIFFFNILILNILPGIYFFLQVLFHVYLDGYKAKYSAGQLRRDTYLRGKDVSFIFQRYFGTNDTSFESPYIRRLESAKKVGMASS